MNSLVLILLCYNIIDYGIASQEFLKTTYEYEEPRLKNKETFAVGSNYEDKSSDYDTKNVSIDNTQMILSEEPTNSSSVQQICDDDQFQCNNHLCISENYKCDGDNDCGDSSDEIECYSCSSENAFMCKNGKCIPKRWKCDFERDCLDGSDETDCGNLTCSEDEFICSNGRCIPIHFRCDKANDCRDGSDEINCEMKNYSCKNDEFQCKNATFHCLPVTWKCDGDEDCADGSDEIDCSNATCASTDFSCGPPTNRCIYASWVCDGDKDCLNGSDEENCTEVIPNSVTTTDSSNCPLGYFFCEGNCYPLAVLCDRKLDCRYGYDESNCTKDSPKVYQIQHIEMNENGINESSLSLHWWTPTSASLEFMPSISQIDENIWINHTWINETEYMFTNLEPYTLYNMTIYVKVANTSTVFPPAKYIVAFTDEGVPSEPYDVKIQQHNISHVFRSSHEPRST